MAYPASRGPFDAEVQLMQAPVYIISKGRADCCLTARFMLRDAVDFRVVVEPQEREAYEKHVPADRLLVTPFSNLGQGGIPARNFVWQHALATGASHHWIFDDNIRKMVRRWQTRKIECSTRAALAAMETRDVPTLSFTPGFPAADFPECGPVVIAYADDPAAASRASDLLRGAVNAQGNFAAVGDQDAADTHGGLSRSR